MLFTIYIKKRDDLEMETKPKCLFCEERAINKAECNTGKIMESLRYCKKHKEKIIDIIKKDIERDNQESTEKIDFDIVE